MKNRLSLEEFVTSQSLFSRRELLVFLQQEKVTVNGKIVSDLNLSLDIKTDVVVVNKKAVEYQFEYLYYRFFKPTGMLSTMEDPKGRVCIGDVIRDMGLPLFPVGRLDRHTSGLMVLTNDGDFSQLLMHPQYRVAKVYRVGLDKKLNSQDKQRLEKGLMLEDGPILFDDVYLNSSKELFLTTHSGRNRIIRRSFEHLGYQVTTLKRTHISGLGLEGMKKQEAIAMTTRDVRALKRQILDSHVDIKT